MKKTKTLYWVFTILFAALMLFSAIPNIMVNDDSVKMVAGTMAYPKYIIPFLGVAKLLGVVGILVPGFPRLKEWAYAGLFFDLIGATYSFIALGGFTVGILPMFGFILLGALSYFFYHKKLKETV